MANNEFMALFGPDSTTVNVISEANAVKYRLVVRGSNTDSMIRDVEVSINGVDLISRSTNVSRGLNLAVIDGTALTLIEYKRFDMYGDPVVNGQAIKDYVSGLPANRIVCFYSYDAMKSTADFDTYMYSIGSRAWGNGTRYMNLPDSASTHFYRPSYCAIYSTTMKKICMENFTGSSFGLGEDSRSFVEVVFDTFDDIGITGIPERMVDDLNEYSSDVYEFHKFGAWNIGSDVYNGDIFKVTADLYADQTLVDEGGAACLYVYSRDTGGQWASPSTVLRTTGLAADTWHSVSGYYTIPNETQWTQLGCSAYRYPSTVTNGVAKIRNVSMTKVPRAEVERGGAAIGVNGIRLSKMVEVDSGGNPIDKLLSVPVATSGAVSDKTISGNFAEMDSIISDPVEYTSSSTTVNLIKNWTIGSAAGSRGMRLDTMGIKAGDEIRVSGELKKNAAAITNGKRGQVICQFWDQSGAFISGSSLHITDLGTLPEMYNFYSSVGTVPENAYFMDIGFYKSPADALAGQVWCKNIKVAVQR